MSRDLTARMIAERSGEGFQTAVSRAQQGLRFRGGGIRAQDRLQDMLREMAHDGHDDAVADEMIGIVVARAAVVGIGQAHQPRRLARPTIGALRTQFPSTRRMRLPARAAGRRAQAARDVVEADLGALQPAAVSIPVACGGRRAPTRRRFELRATAIFFRLTSLISDRSLPVSPGVRQATPFGASSMRSISPAIRGGGSGTRHQIQARFASKLKPICASRSAAGCHFVEIPSASSSLGSGATLPSR